MAVESGDDKLLVWSPQFSKHLGRREESREKREKHIFYFPEFSFWKKSRFRAVPIVGRVVGGVAFWILDIREESIVLRQWAREQHEPAEQRQQMAFLLRWIILWLQTQGPLKDWSWGDCTSGTLIGRMQWVMDRKHDQKNEIITGWNKKDLDNSRTGQWRRICAQSTEEVCNNNKNFSNAKLRHRIYVLLFFF